MKSFSEIDTISKRASKAVGFSWGISEEIGKNTRLLEMFGLPGIKNLNYYFKLYKKQKFQNITLISKLNSSKISYCPIITGVNFFLFATEIAIIFNYLFKDLAILEILYYNSLSVFSSLLSITPASLGIKEFIILISNDLLGVSLENLISVLIIERAISIVFSIIPLFFIFVNSLTQKPN